MLTSQSQPVLPSGDGWGELFCSSTTVVPAVQVGGSVAHHTSIRTYPTHSGTPDITPRSINTAGAVIGTPPSGEIYHIIPHNNWRTKRGMDVTIIKFDSYHCLQLTANDNKDRSMESINEAIYVDFRKLSAKCSDIDDNQLMAIAQRSGSQKLPPFAAYNRAGIATKDAMIKYLTERLSMDLVDPKLISSRSSNGSRHHSDFQLSLRPLPGDDIQYLNGIEQLDIICSKPKGLIVSSSQSSRTQMTDGEVDDDGEVIEDHGKIIRDIPTISTNKYSPPKHLIREIEHITFQDDDNDEVKTTPPYESAYQEDFEPKEDVGDAQEGAIDEDQEQNGQLLQDFEGTGIGEQDKSGGDLSDLSDYEDESTRQWEINRRAKRMIKEQGQSQTKTISASQSSKHSTTNNYTQNGVLNNTYAVPQPRRHYQSNKSYFTHQDSGGSCSLPLISRSPSTTSCESATTIDIGSSNMTSGFGGSPPTGSGTQSRRDTPRYGQERTSGPSHGYGQGIEATSTIKDTPTARLISSSLSRSTEIDTWTGSATITPPLSTGPVQPKVSPPKPSKLPSIASTNSVLPPIASCSGLPSLSATSYDSNDVPRINGSSQKGYKSKRNMPQPLSLLGTSSNDGIAAYRMQDL